MELSMGHENDLQISRKFELETYLKSMEQMYKDAVTVNSAVFDIANSLTDGFTLISSNAILKDSRIIKILRYAIAPSISQMKFGQMFGITSIDKFEIEKLTEGCLKFEQLKMIAGAMASFFQDHIDRDRFLWVTDQEKMSALALYYAKRWTCSIAADQNAQTAYRNWRKEKQEQAIVSHLESMGYVKSSFSGVLTSLKDLNPGEYTREIRVKGRTVQKADIVFRSKKRKGLILLEAKAVGVEIDATKRIKECCDKANDWRSNPLLWNKANPSQIVAVIAGFFTEKNIEALHLSNVQEVWEHKLSALEEVS